MSICQACMSTVDHAASICPYCRSEFVGTGEGAVKPKLTPPNPNYRYNYGPNADPDGIGGAVFGLFAAGLIIYVIWILLPIILTVFACWVIYAVFATFISKPKKKKSG